MFSQVQPGENNKASLSERKHTGYLHVASGINHSQGLGLMFSVHEAHTAGLASLGDARTLH